MIIRKRHIWEVSYSKITTESAFVSRRKFIQAAGWISTGWALSPLARAMAADAPTTQPSELKSLTFQPNSQFQASLPLTPYEAATRYNNFYEFTTDKEKVALEVVNFNPRPWTIEVSGLVKKKRTFDVDQLIKDFSLEERVYRFRCVEAWAMVVPWIGFPLSRLIKRAEVLGSAKFVRFVSFFRPEVAPGIRNQPWYPWPYHEALRMDEAMNELTLITVGMYGKVLPKQNGAPVRIVVPWKYGYKSAKSIVKIEFTEKQPPTFWNTLAPLEYDFLSNVNPKKPHPRWSQEMERIIPGGEKRKTLPMNGYSDQVAHLYKA